MGAAGLAPFFAAEAAKAAPLGGGRTGCSPAADAAPAAPQ